MSNPVLKTVNYNAATGSLSVNGSNLTSALVLGNLTLMAGDQSFTLSTSTDTLSNVSSNGFTVTLSASDQGLVQVSRYFCCLSGASQLQ